jgi:hypothetical protein
MSNPENTVSFQYGSKYRNALETYRIGSLSF